MKAGTPEAVARDIVVRRLQEGDNLPAAAAMLQHYGVSRETSLAGAKVLQLSLLATGQIVTHHVIVNADPRAARERSSTTTAPSPGRPSTGTGYGRARW